MLANPPQSPEPNRPIHFCKNPTTLLDSEGSPRCTFAPLEGERLPLPNASAEPDSSANGHAHLEESLRKSTCTLKEKYTCDIGIISELP